MKKIIVFLVVLLLGILTSCKNSLSDKITIADGKEPFTLNQDMVSRLAALAVTGNCKLDEQQVEDNVLSALSALSENGNERAAVTVKDYTLSAPKVATLKAPASFGKTERSANIQDFDDINLYLYSTNEGKENEGWVLASNDRRVGTIIAIVDGKFPEAEDEEENPFMDIFKAGLENHILETVYTWNSLTEEDIARALSNEDIVTSGDYYYDNWYIHERYLAGDLYRYNWHQDAPFRFAVNTIKENYSYVAGCVPVALGQLFAYYEWPERCSSVQYNVLKNKWEKTKNWDGIYDWEILKCGCLSEPYTYELSHNEDKAFWLNAGALMYDIGANCNAVYTPYLTVVEKSSDIKKALKHYGYLSDNVKTYSWEDVEESIKNRCPVLASGQGQGGGVGHAWVISGCAKLSCDVYKEANGIFFKRIEDRFVYCNVGSRYFESGQYYYFNGYYLSGVFNFCLDYQLADIADMLPAEGDWYIRKKLEQHERAARTESIDCSYSVIILTNIRPEDY